MKLKDILLILEAGQTAAGRLALAARLARDNDAFVTALCLAPDPEPDLADDYAIGAAGVADVVDRLDAARDAGIASTEAAFRGALAGAGLGAAWRRFGSDAPPPRLSDWALSADLVIAQRPAASDPDARARAEALLNWGGTPCLIVPEVGAAPAAFNRVVLAWDGSAPAKRALDAALIFLRWAQAVEVVVVDGPGHARVDVGDLDALLGHLSRHGVPAELSRIGAGDTGVPQAVIAHARAFGADLLVAGAFGRPRLAEDAFGGVTPHLLAHTPAPLLLSR